MRHGTRMKRTSNRSESGGIWLNSDQLHEIRDQIQALRVGFSLLSRSKNLDDDTLIEVNEEISGALNSLAGSVLFSDPNAS